MQGLDLQTLTSEYISNVLNVFFQFPDPLVNGLDLLLDFGQHVGS